MTPTISLGMPAYNSARTIAASIASLQAQTFPDFELVVSDNGSTDATGDIVARIAREDRRLRYVRQAENIGANPNYSFVARAARAEYFKWMSSSDWCAPTFLARCLETLTRHDDVVLAAPRTRLFAGDLSSARDYAFDIEVLEPDPLSRLKRLTADLQLNNAMNGLIRMAALRRTRLIDRYYQADEVLIGHLALLGKIARVDEFLYYRRMEVATSTALQDRAAWRAHHYPKATAAVLFQASKRYLGWLRACRATPMTAAERARVLIYMARMCHWDRRDLATDVRGALAYATGRVFSR